MRCLTIIDTEGHLASRWGARFTDNARWVSTNAQRFGHLEEHQDEGAGYDLELNDVHGLFGQPGVRVLIEVKSSAGAPGNRFIMSWNEWRRAREARTATDPAERYLVIRIGHVESSKPRWVDTIADPVGLEADARLRVLQKEVWVAW